MSHHYQTAYSSRLCWPCGLISLAHGYVHILIFAVLDTCFSILFMDHCHGIRYSDQMSVDTVCTLPHTHTHTVTDTHTHARTHTHTPCDNGHGAGNVPNRNLVIVFLNLQLLIFHELGATCLQVETSTRPETWIRDLHVNRAALLVTRIQGDGPTMTVSRLTCFVGSPHWGT